MDFLHEWRDRLRRWAQASRLKNAKVRRLLLGGLFFALLTFIMLGQVVPQRLDIKVGEVAPREVLAPQDVENRLATERKREAAAAAIPILTKIDPTVLSQAEEYINFAFDQVKTVRDLPNQDAKTKVASLTAKLNLGTTVSPETYTALLNANDSLLLVARQDALRLIRVSLKDGVPKGEPVQDLRDRIDQEKDTFTMDTREPWLKIFVKELVKSQVKSNLVEDLPETEKLREKARLGEEKVMWKKGQAIVKQNEVVTEDQYETLKDLHMIGGEADLRSYIGTGILSLVLVVLMGWYVARYRKDLLENDSKLLLMGVIGIGTLLLSLLMKTFAGSLGSGVYFLMPVAINGMLLSILLETRGALLQNAILSLLVGLSADVDQINVALVALVGSTVGTFAVQRVESRSDIYRAGLLVSAANVVTIIGIYLIKAYSLLTTRPWVDVGLGAANGLFVAMVVTGALPMFESLFGVLTPLKLLELSNPNHPLLKKLLVEAPGSYHHTILVANLCEAAAEAVGADTTLARVGAYYHDIGKTKRPYFFVENQFGGENPHDKLPPSLSALIITSHVKDGLEMAKEARLPQEIIDFIPEHHGTTLVGYFYHKASKNGDAEYVLEEDFRYEGPKPRRKETAILMLADSCEASVRAIRQKGHLTVDQIEGQVNRIIQDRLKQGQLDNCDLTLRELDVIGRTLVKVLSGVHHARVEYPEAMQGKLPGQAAQTEPAAKAPEGGKPDESGSVDQQRPGEGAAAGGAGSADPAGGPAGAGPGGDGDPK
ncbi:MAG TPA: HDIG domain-containing protein [Symbiobacteriaceae bacterium]|nr:HDIG domain-containing protein [Symbiobacteriaceae bacterium]